MDLRLDDAGSSLPHHHPSEDAPKLLVPSLNLCYKPTHCLLWGRECAQLCPTLCDPLDCSPPGSSVHGISKARILEWAAISFSRARQGGRNTVSRGRSPLWPPFAWRSDETIRAAICLSFRMTSRDRGHPPATQEAGFRKRGTHILLALAHFGVLSFKQGVPC